MRRILYPAPATFDTLEYGQDTIEEEILARTQLLMATFNSDITAYGIVDSANARTAISGGTRPLSVGVNTSVTSTLNVNPGTAVFKSGEIIVLSATTTQLTLADSTPNVRNVVYLQFDEQEILPALTRYSTLLNTRVAYLNNEC